MTTGNRIRRIKPDSSIARREAELRLAGFVSFFCFFLFSFACGALILPVKGQSDESGPSVESDSL
jgi:hypothetical protein